jgi:hypothetical protein
MREVMRNTLTAILLLFSGFQIAETAEELDSSSEVLKLFFQLFDDVSFGYDQTEAAGWILFINDEYFLEKWPRVNEEYMQIWTGPIPGGAVAIAHTHPTSDIQKPSEADIALAKRINLPVYTICRSGIFKANKDGVVVKIKPLNWFKELKAKAKVEKAKET